MTDKKTVVLVLFDLPTLNRQQIQEYNRFRKYLNHEGYIRLQKSAYVVLIRDGRCANEAVNKVKTEAPKVNVK